MKKGITVTMMTVVVIVMIILATTITVTINSSIKYSNLSVWANEISIIQDVVYETTLKKSAVDFLLDEVEFNTSGISQDILNEQFKGETITDNTITFNEIDLGKLEIANTVYGNKEEETDIYVYSTTTQKVYYIAGIQDKYYILTEELSNRFSIQSVDTKSSVISFVPSKQGFTNQPINVVVKVPSEFSNVNVTTSVTGMTVANTGTVDNRACYKVNSENLTGNYNITVSYNNGQETLAATYMVNGYDTTKPVIEDITENNLSYKQNETVKKASLENIKVVDTESGIDKVWYIKGTIPTATQDVLEYFKLNGTKIRKNKFNVEYLNGTYTICAVDRAGNYTYGVCEITSKSNGWTQTSDRTVVKGDTVLNIGDTINYKSNVSGYNDTNGWQVLGAENGELLILSASSVASKNLNEEDTLEGAKKAYENGISELNKLCEPYGKGAYALGARSITVEDVDRVTAFDKAAYGKNSLNEYGNVVTYKYNGTNKPAYESSNGVRGTLSMAHNYGFYWYDEEKGWQNVTATALTNTANNGDKIAKLTNTYYEYDVDRSTDLAGGTNAYNMLFGSSNENIYWLASSCVATYRSAIEFGLRRVYNGSVFVNSLINSGHYCYPRENGVRAVVRISPNVKVTGSSANGWNIIGDGWTQTSDRKVKKGDTVLNIGDTINYDATNAGTISGLEDANWQVLGAENGRLLILSTKIIHNSKTMLKGKDGYVNGISILNSACAPYGKGTYALGARNITVEDVDKVTGYDKTQYGKGTIKEYGNEMTVKYNGLLKPAYEVKVGENGTFTDTHSDGFYWYDSNLNQKSVTANELTSNSTGEITTLVQTAYEYIPETDTDLKEKSEKAYNMLFSKSTGYYLASPQIDLRNYHIEYGYAHVWDELVTGPAYGVYLTSEVSDTDSYEFGGGARAVVELSQDISLEVNSNNSWDIKGDETSSKVSWKVLE